jgi:predicted nucleotidyltransferase component of viral defense system
MGVTRELVEDVAAELVFAGGTCLSKILPSLRRMSEDVDLKVLPTEQGQQLKSTQHSGANHKIMKIVIPLCDNRFR